MTEARGDWHVARPRAPRPRNETIASRGHTESQKVLNPKCLATLDDSADGKRVSEEHMVQVSSSAPLPREMKYHWPGAARRRRRPGRGPSWGRTSVCTPSRQKCRSTEARRLDPCLVVGRSACREEERGETERKKNLRAETRKNRRSGEKLEPGVGTELEKFEPGVCNGAT